MTSNVPDRILSYPYDAASLNNDPDPAENNGRPITHTQAADTVPVPPWRPFPVGAMPEPCRSFIEDGAKAIGCDPSYIALPLLAGLASAIGNSRVIQLKRGWCEPSILWCAIIGESGTLKSPALEFAMRPLRNRQRQAMKSHTEDMKRYRVELLRYERNLAAWKHSKSYDDPPEKSEEPTADRCWTDDATIEALAVLLRDNPHGLIVIRDELGGWLRGFDRYSKGHGEVAKWLEMHGGRALIVDRKTSGSLYIPRAAVSICGGIQPGVLRRALGVEHFEDGLAARLLLAWPPRRTKRWTEAEISPELERSIEAIFGRLFELEPDLNDDGSEYPRAIRLSSNGKRAWVQFHDTHAEEQASLTGNLAAAWSKLEGYTARLALVIHCVRWTAGDPTLESRDEVDAESIESAIELVDCFKNEAERIYGGLDVTAEDRDRRQLIDWIDRHGGKTTARDLSHGPRRFRGDTGLAEQALQNLVEDGLVRCENPQQRGRGRPTGKIYILVGSTGTGTKNTPGGAVNPNYGAGATGATVSVEKTETPCPQSDPGCPESADPVDLPSIPDELDDRPRWDDDQADSDREVFEV